MANHNLRRYCEWSANNLISDLSDCEDSSNSGIYPQIENNLPNFFPSSRPPNFTKSQIRRHFGVPEKREMVASTPVFRIRKRKSETPSGSSISLSPIEKQNSVQACHIISAKKPDCQKQLQFEKETENFDVQAMEIKRNAVVTPPLEDLETVTKKKRLSLLSHSIKNDNQMSAIIEKQPVEKTTEGSAKNLKEDCSNSLMPVVKLVKLPLNNNNPTVNKSIQLSCKQKKKTRSEPAETDELENIVEEFHLPISKQNKKKLQTTGSARTRSTSRTHCSRRNEEIQEENDNLQENNRTLVIKRSPSAETVVVNYKKFAKEKTRDKEYMEEHEDLEKRNYSKNLHSDSIEPLFDKIDEEVKEILLKKGNYQDDFAINCDLFNRIQMNKTKEHHTSIKLQPKKLFNSDEKEIEDDRNEENYRTTRREEVEEEPVPQQRSTGESLNVQNNVAVNSIENNGETSVNKNNKSRNINKLVTNLINTASRIENHSLGNHDNDEIDSAKNHVESAGNNSIRSEDAKRDTRLSRKKSQVVNRINVLETSEKKSIDKVEQIEQLHKTRTSSTKSNTTADKNYVKPTGSNSIRIEDAKRDTRSSRKKSNIVNRMNVLETSAKKSTDKIEQVEEHHRTSATKSNTTVKSIKKKVKEKQTVKKKSIKETDEKENINPKSKKSQQLNKSAKSTRTTSTRQVKNNKYAEVLHDLLQEQRDKAKTYYVNTSSVSTISQNQSSGERRSSRVRQQTRTFTLETMVITEKEFLTYCGMNRKQSTHSRRSKKSVVDNHQKSQFKVPSAPPPSSKNKSKKKTSESSPPQSDLPDSGNYSMTYTSNRSNGNNNVDNVQTTVRLENDIFLPPIIEENNDVIAAFNNNDSRERYNKKNTSSEMQEPKNRSQKEKRDDRIKQNEILIDQNEVEKNTENNTDTIKCSIKKRTRSQKSNKSKTDYPDNYETVDENPLPYQPHEGYNLEELDHDVIKTSREIKSSKKSSRRSRIQQVNNVADVYEEKNKDFDHEKERTNSKGEFLKTATHEEIPDKWNLKNKEPQTINISSDSLETNQSPTEFPHCENNFDVNNICYVINNHAMRTAWCQKKPELTPVVGQRGIYIGYSASNWNLGFCAYSMGLMQIDENCFKKQCYFKTSHAFYFVIEGEAEVILCHQRMRVQAGQSFFVPLGIDYSIINHSKTEKLLLLFTQIKAPK